ncbi:hypothetical protein BURPS1710b_1811 [Burkholderia pseudomallei 1710b]|uniref:Uncharacterized protein n=1 Tax=Burkholderia pseudomallei (strain 1710b) TaxID=320372 RepID=Q3JT93_BURP1|nr:hypothetical protein BURPS1710b_1811 [Burkholderia pseudomallei 1710b]
MRPLPFSSPVPHEHRTQRRHRAFQFHPQHHRRRQPHGQMERARRNALSARAERLSAHRSCEEHLPELQRRARLRRRVPPALRRYESGKGKRRVRELDRRRGALARLRLAEGRRRPSILRERLLRQALRIRRAADPARLRVRRQPERRRNAHEPRLAHRAGHAVAVPRPLARRKPRAVSPDEGGRVRRRRARAAREDRHELAEHEHARPGDLPDPLRASLPDGRQVVRVPDVRLHALHLGCARRHHALAVHARIRGSPPALRLGAQPARRRRRVRAAAAAANRILASEPHLCDHEQAQIAAARDGRPRRRLGRSADADDRRRAPPRLHAGEHPAVLRADRRDEGRFVDRHERVRRRAARRSRRQGAAHGRRARSAQARHRQLPARPERGMHGARAPAPPGARPAHVPDLARAVDRARGFQRASAEGLFPAIPGQQGAAALRLRDRMHGRGQGRARQRDRRALQLLSGQQVGHRRREQLQGEGQHPLGERRARVPRRSADLRSPVQGTASGRGRAQLPRGAESGFEEDCSGVPRAGRARRAAGGALSVRAARLLRRRSRRFEARPAGVQPDRRPARQLGQAGLITAARDDPRDAAPKGECPVRAGHFRFSFFVFRFSFSCSLDARRAPAVRLCAFSTRAPCAATSFVRPVRASIWHRTGRRTGRRPSPRSAHRIGPAAHRPDASPQAQPRDSASDQRDRYARRAPPHSARQRPMQRRERQRRAEQPREAAARVRVDVGGRRPAERIHFGNHPAVATARKHRRARAARQIGLAAGRARGEQMQVLVAPVGEQAEIDEPRGIEHDARLLGELAQRRLLRGLARLALPLRDVPVRRVGRVREQHAAAGIEQHDAARYRARAGAAGRLHRAHARVTPASALLQLPLARRGLAIERPQRHRLPLRLDLGLDLAARAAFLLGRARRELRRELRAAAVVDPVDGLAVLALVAHLLHGLRKRCGVRLAEIADRRVVQEVQVVLRVRAKRGGRTCGAHQHAREDRDTGSRRHVVLLWKRSNAPARLRSRAPGERSRITATNGI